MARSTPAPALTARFILLIFALTLLLPDGAAAQGVSLDTQQLHPSFAPHGWWQHPGARLGGDDMLRVGTMLQLERSPLVLKLPDAGTTVVIPHRFTTTVGAFLDINGRVGAQLSVPIYGLDLADGEGTTHTPAVGDVRAQLLIPVLQQQHIALALSGQLAVPSSTHDVWIGERGVRVSGGVVAEGGIKRFTAMFALSVLSRMDIDTGMGVVVGDELRFQAGVGLALVPDRWSVLLEWQNTTAFTQGDDPIGTCPGVDGELPEEPVEYEESAFYGINPMEMRLGTRIFPARWLRLDVGVGLGMNLSIGAPQVRVFTGMSVIVPAPRRTPKVKDEPEKVTEPTEPDPFPDDFSVDADDEPSSGPEPPEEEPLCLSLGAPILFDRNSAALSPTAEQALDEVAHRIWADPEIAHLVVEGHASCEGELEANFDLSRRRAEAAYRYLVDAGVSARRLSYRGLGEILTTDPSPQRLPDEADRRVLICVSRQLDFVDDPLPDWAAIAVPPPWK